MQRIIVFFLFAIVVKTGYAQLATTLIESGNFNVQGSALHNNVKSLKIFFDQCNSFKNNSSLLINFSKQGFVQKMTFGLPDSNYVCVDIQQERKKIFVRISGTPLAFYMKSQVDDFAPYSWPNYDFIKSYRSACKIIIDKSYLQQKDSSIEVITKVNDIQILKDIHVKDLIQNFYTEKRSFSPKEIYTPSNNYSLLNIIYDSITGEKIERFDWMPGDKIADLELQFNKAGLLVSQKKYHPSYSGLKNETVTIEKKFVYNSKDQVIAELFFQDGAFVCRKNYFYEFW